MKAEKILLIAVIVLLSISIVLPIVLMSLIDDKAKAGQIGDALGGTTTPLISIAAILTVVATYYYQRRNDQKNVKRDLLAANFQHLREEFNGINHIVTITTGGKKEIHSYTGKEAIDYIIRSLNNDQYKLIDVMELITFKPILNVYQYLNLLIDDLNEDSLLTKTDKKLLLTQFSLFYRNNLFIGKQQRGDEVCKDHGKLHKIPDELYSEIVSIEKKIR